MIDLKTNYRYADGDFTREEFIEEFAYRYKSGQHTILFGSVGRGKTTTLGQMLAQPGVWSKTDGMIIAQFGPDPALAHLGKPTRSWPLPEPVLRGLIWDHKDQGKPFIRRYQSLPKKPEDFISKRRMTSRILRWMFGRENFTLVIPDLQVVTDPGMMGLGKEVDQLILTTRKRGSGVFMDAQAPRWIPTSSKDNTQHLVVWPTRNEDHIRALGRLIGVDWRIMTNLFSQMHYHDSLWCDVIEDEYYIVRRK
jgi:hypothetical protein